jgi:Holliday junction DNA helicase RuvA
VIYSLRGLISNKSTDSIRILVSGFEFELHMSAFSIQELPNKGEEARIYSWLYHREDAMSLFGFSREEERMLFLELIKVNGIGPKQAVKMLSSAPVETLIKMIEEGKPENLATLPGIGKKTASKILLTLQDKLVLPGTQTESDQDELVIALVQMGFDKKSVLPIVRNLRIADSDLSEQEILKQAIVSLSGDA